MIKSRPLKHCFYGIMIHFLVRNSDNMVWVLVTMLNIFVMVDNAMAVVYGKELTVEVKNKEYPSAISIMMHSQVHCSGVLIKAEWTLTTCSCVGHFVRKSFIFYRFNSIVLIGGSRSNVVSSDNYEHVQLRKPENAYRHLSCNEEGKVWAQDYGAYMSKAFVITKVLRPAEFQPEDRLRAACKTIGWGATVINFTTQYFKPSNILREADVHLMDWTECGLKLCQQPLSICDEKIYNEGKLCAMNMKGSDSCDKDEGGALVCGGGWIVGLASKSLTCGEYFKPRLYSSILDGYSWIHSLLDGSINNPSSTAHKCSGISSHTCAAFTLIFYLIK